MDLYVFRGVAHAWRRLCIDDHIFRQAQVRRFIHKDAADPLSMTDDRDAMGSGLLPDRLDHLIAPPRNDRLDGRRAVAGSLTKQEIDYPFIRRFDERYGSGG